MKEQSMREKAKWSAVLMRRMRASGGWASWCPVTTSISYDKYFKDQRFPKWALEDVVPAPRSLLSYAGKKYMIANDHYGQLMYHRRDLLQDPTHRAAFKKKYGYALGVPATWAQFRDVAEYFDNKDLDGDGVSDHGLTMDMKVGAQGMFHFMSFSAPFAFEEITIRLGREQQRRSYRAFFGLDR